MASLTFPTPTQLVNVGDPTANSDAATKYYVDTQISGGTVSNANYANFAGTVTSSAQPNITSLGNLTGLTSGGNVDFTGASNVALGPVTNVHITGGTSGYILQTDGTGNLSWLAPSSGSGISNGNSNINIPTVNGNINLTAVGNTTMVITGTGANISGTANVTGNITAGNANLGNSVTANYFTGTLTTNAQPNITSVGNLSSLTVDNGTYGNVVITQFGSVYASGTGSNPYSIMQVTSNDTTTGMGMRAYTGLNGQIYSNSGITFTTGATIRDKDYPTGGTSRATLDSNGLAVTGNITAGNANLGNSVTSNYFTGTLTTAAQPNITSVGTLTDLSVSGNGVFGGNLTVNGTLTYINSTTLSISDPIINLQTGPNGAAPVANSGKDVGTALNYFDTSAKIAWMGWDVSNAEIAFGSNVDISSEVVTFTSLANIRSGNAQLGNNVTANYFTGNGSLLTGISTASISNGNSNVNIPAANGNINLTAVGNTTVVITGTGANISGTANVTGNLIAGNIIAGSGSGGNITNANVISANTFTASGNITAGNFIGILANGNSNINIPTSNGNINFSAVGNANVVVITGTGANIAGTANITGNLVAGNANLGNLVTANYFTGTLTTNAQPNITSVGSLTGLTVSNATGVVNLTTTANVTLGAVANLHISGGTSGYVLQTDGSGTLSWVAQSGGGSISNISNGNSNVNIPSANGNINFSAVGNANVVVITGTGANISGTANITCNLTAGNIIAGSGTGGNITNANVISANTFTATGNITAGNFIGILANGNSNVNIPSANGNINFGAVGNANVVVITGTGANIAGTLNVTGQSNLGAVGNVVITGGTNGYILKTNGSGTLSWVAQQTLSIAVDSFTGDGSTVVFTLSVTPANVNYTTVNYNGAIQFKSSYTVSGTTLTFSSAPALGSAIEVTTLQFN